MIKKLLKLFSGVEKAESLEKWLQERIESEKNILKQAQKKRSLEVKASFDKIEANLSALEHSELKNKKVPKRALQIMEGNRNSYIRNVRNFMERTDTEPDEDFPLQLKKDLELLGQNNSRASKILGEFFLNETSRVSEGLRDLIIVSKQVESDYNRIKPILKIKDQLAKEEQEHERLDTIKTNIDKKKAELRKVAEKQKELEKLLLEIESSAEYKNHQDMIKKKAEIKESIAAAERKINEYFSQVKPALKKYAHMSMEEKSINEYLDDTTAALLADSDLKIIKILDDMQSVLDKGQIEMKEKKLEKIKAFTVDKDDLKSMATGLKNLRKQKKETEEKIRQTHMGDYDEAEYNLRHVKEKIDHIQNEISTLEKQASKIDPGIEREKAMQMVKEQGIELVII